MRGRQALTGISLEKMQERYLTYSYRAAASPQNEKTAGARSSGGLLAYELQENRTADDHQQDEEHQDNPRAGPQAAAISASIFSNTAHSANPLSHRNHLVHSIL